MTIKMKYFEAENGEIFAYDEEQVAIGLGADKRALTDAEADAHENPKQTAEQMQAQINTEARTYLTSTDWYVIRWQENGTPIPEDIATARTEARANVIEV